MLSATVDNRLQLCNELLSLRQRLEAADDTNKIKVGVMAGRRMGAIRRVLLGRKDASLADEMLSPGLADARLMAAMDAAKDQPEHVRVATAAYAKSILATLRVIRAAEARIGMADRQGYASTDLERAIEEVLPGDAHGPQQADPVIDDCIRRGAPSIELHAELDVACAGGTDADEQVSGMTRLLASGYDKASAQQTALYSSFKALRDKGELRDDDVSRAYKEYTDFLTEIAPVIDANQQVLAAARSKANNAFARVGKQILANAMDDSPITADDATRWAAAQEITPPAVARLRKLGYPQDKVRADMAEFYRFTRGRVTTARIHSAGDRRANATNIEAHGELGTINLGSAFDKRVLWHELAHHMEVDPVAKLAAGRMIRRRSVDGKAYSMRNLTGNKAYKSSEIAYKGNFFSPYVGKIYADGVTEVFAMGVESFSDPETLARRMANDPQTLAFIAGFVKADVSPLAKVNTDLRDMLKAMTGEVKEGAEASLDALIAALAATVTLTPDTGADYWADEKRNWVLHHNKISAVLGQFEDSGYWLMAGKVRNPDTLRRGNGLVLMHQSGERFSTQTIPGTDQSIAKAIFAVWKKHGVMPSLHNMTDPAYLTRMSV